MIYLYAITEPHGKLPDCPGLDDQPLHHESAADVGALYSEHANEVVEPDANAAWRHDRVLEAAMRLGPVLPARFGTTFPDRSALIAALEPRQAAFRRALENVRGCVELAIRVTLPTAETPTCRTGQEYVQARLMRQRERRAVVEQTLVPLSAHAVRAWAPSLDSGSTMLRASYLVRADEVPRFAEEVQQLADRHSELSLSCTGPWAPYSFVAGDE
jgi:hypothetical protein